MYTLEDAFFTDNHEFTPFSLGKCVFPLEKVRVLQPRIWRGTAEHGNRAWQKAPSKNTSPRTYQMVPYDPKRLSALHLPSV
jgi:hypothetical protein